MSMNNEMTTLRAAQEAWAKHPAAVAGDTLVLRERSKKASRYSDEYLPQRNGKTVEYCLRVQKTTFEVDTYICTPSRVTRPWRTNRA